MGRTGLFYSSSDDIWLREDCILICELLLVTHKKFLHTQSISQIGIQWQNKPLNSLNFILQGNFANVQYSGEITACTAVK